MLFINFFSDILSLQFRSKIFDITLFSIAMETVACVEVVLTVGGWAKLFLQFFRTDELNSFTRLKILSFMKVWTSSVHFQSHSEVLLKQPVLQLMF